MNKMPERIAKYKKVMCDFTHQLSSFENCDAFSRTWLIVALTFLPRLVDLLTLGYNVHCYSNKALYLTILG